MAPAKAAVYGYLGPGGTDVTVSVSTNDGTVLYVAPFPSYGGFCVCEHWPMRSCKIFGSNIVVSRVWPLQSCTFEACNALCCPPPSTHIHTHKHS